MYHGMAYGTSYGTSHDVVMVAHGTTNGIYNPMGQP